MKAVLASVFAALFALAAVTAHAAVPAQGAVVYSDDSKDEAKSPTDGTEKKADEDDKKKPEEDDKKS